MYINPLQGKDEITITKKELQNLMWQYISYHTNECGIKYEILNTNEFFISTVANDPIYH